MAAYPYDIKFTSGGIEYGFMCVTPPGESKSLAVMEVGGPDAQARVTTGAAFTHSDFAPQQDIPFAQYSFAGGLGQLEFDGGEEDRYLWANGVITHVDGKLFLAPPATTRTLTSAAATVGGFRTYYATGGTRYDFCWAGTRLYRSSGTTWAVVYTASFPITDVRIFDGKLVVAYPSSSGATDDFSTLVGDADQLGGTLTATTRNHSAFSVGAKPKYFVPVRGTLFAFVDSARSGSLFTGGVFYTVDVTQDSWAGPITVTVGSVTAPDVGDTSWPFTGGLAVNDYIFAFKQSAAYSIDSGQNVTETLWQWKDKPGNENFKHVAVGGDLLYYSVGPEVYVYDPGTGQNLPLKIARQSAFSVQSILGVAADVRCAYILAQVRVPNIRSAASIACFRAHRRGGTTWAFECLWEDTTVTETYGPLTAAPSGAGTRLMWGKYNGSIYQVGELTLPADWDESISASFDTSGQLWTSITYAGFPGLDKRTMYFSFDGEGLAAGKTVAVAYTVNYGTSYADLLAATATAPQTVNLASSSIGARSLGLRFTLATNDATVTPIVRSFDHHMRPRFRYLPALSTGVRLADNVERGNKSRDKKTLAQLRANLETLRTTDDAILYEDFTGNSFYCSVDSYTYRPTRHEHPVNEYELEGLITVVRADSGA